MVSCKIFLSSLKLAPDSASKLFQDLIIKELDTEEDPNVEIINTLQITPGECHIEVSCLKKPDRTHQKLQALAIQLDESARQYFQIEDPIRVRVIQIEEDSVYGVN
ncbi:hypothetical protein ACJJI5_04355 [Microbulbifer sp. EKSA008]|uniref:hypothetical protein n=1 Tax=unclassified Microbulbifer TaxID=2619833 RepID=UPI00403A6D7D